MSQISALHTVLVQHHKINRPTAFRDEIAAKYGAPVYLKTSRQENSDL